MFKERSPAAFDCSHSALVCPPDEGLCENEVGDPEYKWIAEIGLVDASPDAERGEEQGADVIPDHVVPMRADPQAGLDAVHGHGEGSQPVDVEEEERPGLQGAVPRDHTADEGARDGEHLGDDVHHAQPTMSRGVAIVQVSQRQLDRADDQDERCRRDVNADPTQSVAYGSTTRYNVTKTPASTATIKATISTRRSMLRSIGMPLAFLACVVTSGRTPSFSLIVMSSVAVAPASSGARALEPGIVDAAFPSVLVASPTTGPITDIATPWCCRRQARGRSSVRHAVAMQAPSNKVAHRCVCIEGSDGVSVRPPDEDLREQHVGDREYERVAEVGVVDAPSDAECGEEQGANVIPDHVVLVLADPQPDQDVVHGHRKRRQPVNVEEEQRPALQRAVPSNNAHDESARNGEHLSGHVNDAQPAVRCGIAVSNGAQRHLDRADHQDERCRRDVYGGPAQVDLVLLSAIKNRCGLCPVGGIRQRHDVQCDEDADLQDQHQRDDDSRIRTTELTNAYSLGLRDDAFARFAFHLERDVGCSRCPCGYRQVGPERTSHWRHVNWLPSGDLPTRRVST